MELKNKYEQSKKGISFPNEMKYLSDVDGEIIATGLLANKPLQKLWKTSALALEKQFENRHSKRDDKILALKCKHIQQEIMSTYMLEYFLSRDDCILMKNNLIKEQKIYKFDKDQLTKDDLYDLYHSQKGAKRFPTQVCYDFYIATGKEPYHF